MTTDPDGFDPDVVAASAIAAKIVACLERARTSDATDAYLAALNAAQDAASELVTELWKQVAGLSAACGK